MDTKIIDLLFIKWYTVLCGQILPAKILFYREALAMNENKKIEKIVELLHKNCRLSLEQVAAIAEVSTEEAASVIDDLEKNGTILGYGAVINWEKLAARDKVTAYIELKVTPQRNNGFNRIAQQIYQYPEVKSLNLMSGGYDFGVTVEGNSIRDISLFVSEHLAPMESVLSTATHFVLRRFKDDGIIFPVESEDDREVISL